MYFAPTHDIESKASLLCLLCATCLITVGLPGLTHAVSDDGGSNKPNKPEQKTTAKTTCTPNPNKDAFFGETHLHTGMSFDASAWLVPTTPRDAYAFAKGQAGIKRVGPDGRIREDGLIDRPLDWGAVTDHSEYFGEMGLCKYDQFGVAKKSPPPGAYSLDCQLLTGFYWQPPKEDGAKFNLMTPGSMQAFSIFTHKLVSIPSYEAPDYNTRLPVCEDGRANCDLSLWKEMQAAAAEANEPCKFTSFVGYEVTSTPGGTNWHRNVIFANDQVIDEPVTAIDMAAHKNRDPNNEPPRWSGAPDVTNLWDGLQEKCLDAGTGCDVITIPHNSNLGGGIYGPKSKKDPIIPPLFFDPENKTEAQRRQQFEPLVEIYQHKGSSECRWDPRYGKGVDTRDEFCDFELLDANELVSSGNNDQPPPISNFPAKSYVRNVLKDGLRLEQDLGVNPFKLGIVAASDSHGGDMGWRVEDERFGSSVGIMDAIPVRSSTIQYGSGGLSVVWAKENTRESIFEALKNRETYGTSGTRIKVRFFGGWDFAAASCASPANLIQTGYQQGVGVPMGQDLPSKTSNAPQFIVQAEMDDFPVGKGTPLDRIQIIKGWVDADGKTHEKVFHVAGDIDTATETVDPQTCRSPEAGYQNLCQIFTDPDFDPTKPAFYYARVLEKPVCRYSTRYCRTHFNVDPLSLNCKNQLADLEPAQAMNAQACCSNETTNPIVQPVIQERAWTSPIWYRPSSS